MDLFTLNNEFKEKKANNKKVQKPLASLKTIAEQCLAKSREASLIKKATLTINEDEFRPLYNKGGFHLPSRFRNADLKDFGFKDEILNKYFRESIFKKALRMGKGIVLCGSYGKGKTHFAYAFAKEYIRTYANYERTESRHPFLVDFQEIQNELHGDDRNKFIDNCIKASLLIIDDFMSIDFTAWEMGQLTHIFNKRYNFMKPVVLTTNLSPDELRNKCGSRLWERVSASNYIKEVTGKSRRPEFDNFRLEA